MSFPLFFAPTCCATPRIHLLASNCDLCFGYLLNFAHLHSILFHIHIHIVPVLQLHILYLLINTYLTLQSRFHYLLVSITNQPPIVPFFACISSDNCKTLVRYIRACSCVPPRGACSEIIRDNLHRLFPVFVFQWQTTKKKKGSLQTSMNVLAAKILRQTTSS
jgi:hypothetical protein